MEFLSSQSQGADGVSVIWHEMGSQASVEIRDYSSDCMEATKVRGPQEDLRQF